VNSEETQRHVLWNMCAAAVATKHQHRSTTKRFTALFKKNRRVHHATYEHVVSSDQERCLTYPEHVVSVDTGPKSDVKFARHPLNHLLCLHFTERTTPGEHPFSERVCQPVHQVPFDHACVGLTGALFVEFRGSSPFIVVVVVHVVCRRLAVRILCSPQVKHSARSSAREQTHTSGAARLRNDAAA
jgi:hypothetical protein